MAVVARRLGMDSKDPELEQRLRRIEQVLSKKAAANEFADEQSGANLDIPKPENLASENHIDKWKVTWDPVEIPDVKRYEMKVGGDSAFSTVIGEYARTEPEFTYPGASADITYFIKVRAVNMDSEEGPWSDTLNVQTGGTVGTLDIEPNALTQLWEFNQTDGFTHLYAGSLGKTHPDLGDPVPVATEDEFGPVVVTVSSADAIVLPFAIFDVYYQSIYQEGATGNPWTGIDPLNMPENYVRIRFDRAPAGTGIKTNLMEMFLDYWSTIPFSPGWADALNLEWASPGEPLRGYDVATTRISLPLLPDAPGLGTFDYTLTVTVVSEMFMYLLPINIKLRFLEYKNT